MIIIIVFFFLLNIYIKVAEELEELDIDMEDPDLHKAATKIQATFKGHKARKELTDEKTDE